MINADSIDYDGSELTFSWAEEPTTVYDGRQIRLKECVEIPHEFVQLPVLKVRNLVDITCDATHIAQYNSAIMLWDDLYDRTLGKYADTIRDQDLGLDERPYRFWFMTTGRHNGGIFDSSRGTNELARQAYKKLWKDTLDAAFAESKKYSPSTTKVKNFDVRGRYFTPSSKENPYTLILVPHADWLTRDVLVECAKSVEKNAKGLVPLYHVAPQSATGTILTEEQSQGKQKVPHEQVAKWAKELVTTNPAAAAYLLKAAQSGFGMLKIGMHPLGLYSTWISTDQVNDLILEMTGTDSWVRYPPGPAVVPGFNDRLQDYGVLARDLVTIPTKSVLPLFPGRDQLNEKRRGTASIMGDSANKVSLRFQVTLSIYLAYTALQNSGLKPP